MFEPRSTPAQQAALARLETVLALVEGWVDEVVGQATEERMPSAAKLREAVRRRRAAGGPAEQTFAALVGLELRPRRLRDASALWGALRDARGRRGPRRGLGAPRPAADERPTSTTRWASSRERRAAEVLTDDEFDAALRKLLERRGRPATPLATPTDGASATLHADALRVLRGWTAPDAGQDALRAAYLEHLPRTRTGCGVPAPPTT